MGSIEHLNGTVGHLAYNGSIEGRKLWEHPEPRSSRMYDFLLRINRNHGVQLETYDDLHTWSIANIARFWEEVWHYTGVRASKPYSQVVDEQAPMFPRPAWFTGSMLNFAENLLYPAEIDESQPAVLAASETSRETVSWQELRERVKQCQAGMITLGLKAGDRVAGYVANHVNALVAMLATTSLGGIWTAVSPDTGVYAVLERLLQIEPCVLFTDNAAFYNGRSHPVLPKVAEIAAGLPSLKAVVVFHVIQNVHDDLSQVRVSNGHLYSYSDFVKLDTNPGQLRFEQLPPDHPVYILYSSGTTGAPKCIVHGAIGTLIQHKKEHLIHCSIKPGSKLFYFTTCTWMMWHWLVSGLASGATVVLYDGSPFRSRSEHEQHASVPDDLAMPRLISELGITHFGTSARYLSVLEQRNARPMEELSLDTLEAVYSTGSPLAPSTFVYVYEAFPSKINLGSITGGTDIISLFGGPTPLAPVYAGEIQKVGLGMDVRAWDYEGNDVSKSGEAGDLVCVKPFPCQPVNFWGPTGDMKYRSSYFERFEGVWHHGDFVRFNTVTGGLVMLGRSDGVLKPAGVRFGSAEIYNVLLKHFPDEVSDALCIGRRRPHESDETVCLFLKMAAGKRFDEHLAANIKAMVKKELSPRHVPGVIDECPEIPLTSNGKKVEAAVKQILCGLNVKTGASVANADSLNWYRQWSQNHP